MQDQGVHLEVRGLVEAHTDMKVVAIGVDDACTHLNALRHATLVHIWMVHI